MLVDFKGGATFASLDRLPHTAAVITNLADELPLVDRMVDAINGELIRRQELLRRAGNFASLRDYEQARAGGAAARPAAVAADHLRRVLRAAVAPSPTSSTCSSRSAGSAGRSACTCCWPASGSRRAGCAAWTPTCRTGSGCGPSRRWSPGRCSACRTRYELPRSPGHGYLKFGTEPLVRFKAAYVSGPVRTAGARPRPAAAGRRRPRVLDYSTHVRAGARAGRAGRQPAAAAEEPSRREPARRAGRPAGRPGAAGAPGLAAAAGPVARPSTSCSARSVADPARGLAVRQPRAARRAAGAGRARRQAVRAAARPAVAGTWTARPGTSRSSARRRAASRTALRTLICALALTHTPAEVQVYCLDFGGGALAALRDLPHVGGVAGRLDTDGGPPYGRRGRHPAHRAGAPVRRAGRRLDGRLPAPATRPATAGRRGRRRPVRRRVPGRRRLGHAARRVRGPGAGDHRHRHPRPVLRRARGRQRGSRWMDFRPAIRDLFGSRLELRLGDPTDSVVNRRAAADVPEQPAAAGASPRDEPALPHRAARSSTGGDTGDLVKAVAGGLDRPAGARGCGCCRPVAALRRAGHRRAATGLRAARSASPRPTCGRSRSTSPPSRTSWSSATPSAASRRSCAALATSIIRPVHPGAGPDHPGRLPAQPARRRRDRPPASGTAPRRRTTARADRVGGRLHAAPAARPGRHRRQQLRDRSWWTGPELFVLVDDYDLVAPARRTRCAPLLEYLPQARDVGLHLVLTRRGRRRRPGAVRAGHPAAARAVHARPGDVRRPGRGRAGRHGPAGAAAAGPRPAGHPARGRPPGPAGAPAAIVMPSARERPVPAGTTGNLRAAGVAR